MKKTELIEKNSYKAPQDWVKGHLRDIFFDARGYMKGEDI